MNVEIICEIDFSTAFIRYVVWLDCISSKLMMVILKICFESRSDRLLVWCHIKSHRRRKLRLIVTVYEQRKSLSFNVRYY